MTNNKDIVEKLSQFNNISFTKKQWDIILKGCGCPKSSYFWKSLRDNNMLISGKLFTLVNINTESFEKVWNAYCKSNRESVNKAHRKVKAQEKAKQFKGITLFMIGGSLTTEIPERD